MKTRIIAITLLVIGIVFAGFTFLKPKSDSSSREIAITEEAVSNISAKSESDFLNIENEKVLTPFTPENLSQAVTDDGVAIIFFHAEWCPFCRNAEVDILSKFDQIPEDVTILKADYDSEKELRQLYGVTTQHTFVQVNENGDEITKWIGGDTLEQILANIK